MKKHVYNGFLNLDRFPTADELQGIDLEEMEKRIDTCENELKKMTK